jgi:large subunit ribosomal protein L31
MPTFGRLCSSSGTLEAPVPVHPHLAGPGDHHRRSNDVKPDIHPEYVETSVSCTCGNTFTTRSTAKNGVIHADVCSACHPFYTGKQKILDTGGRVARFEQRYKKK